MPPAIAAVAAAYAKHLVVRMIVNFVISQVISAVFNKLSGKKSKSSSLAQQQSDIKHMFRGSVEARRLIYGEVQTSGVMYALGSTGSKNEYFHFIVLLAGHEVDSIGDVWVGERLSTHSKISGLVRINKHLGEDEQLADTHLISDLNFWTSKHRLQGIAYLAVRLKWDQDVWVNGIPNIRCMIKGKKVFDPRTETTQWSNNWALCMRDYFVSVHGLNANDDEIDDIELINSANISDELVNLTSGTQKRYLCDGVITLDKKPSEVVDDLLTASAGAYTYSQGVYKIFAAAYSTPVISLDESDLRGAIQVFPRIPKRDLFNAVQGVYVSPEDNWESADFPPVTNDLYQAQDGDEQLFLDIELPFTKNVTRAQRLAKIHLEKSRQGITVSFPAKLTALEITSMDVVLLSIKAMGWVNKPFRVTDWSITDSGLPDLELQEDSAESYNWNYGNATTVDHAPDTTLPDPTLIFPVTSLTATSGTDELIIGNDGTVQSRVRLDWESPNDVFVVEFEVQYRVSGSTKWLNSSSPDATANTTWISGVEDSLLYDIRVRSISIINVRSSWEYVYHFVKGKSAPPSDVVNLNVDRQADGTRQFSWDSIADADLAGYKIRAKSGSGAVWDAMTPMHEGVLVSSPWETNLLAAGDYTLAIKAIDTSGNESINEAIIQSTLGDPRIANSLKTVNPHNAGWQGTITDGVIDANGIIAIGNYEWDDLTTWDAWFCWQKNWSTQVTYEHTVIDVGASVSFVPLITADTVGTQLIEISTSDDDVTYSEWHVPDGIEATRYIKIRIMVTYTPAPPQINRLAIILSGEVLEETVIDSNTATWAGSASAGRIIPIQKTYALITNVNLALQSVGAGWTWEVLSKSNTGPIIRIYNNGAAADAVVDVNIKGIPEQ